MTKLRISDSLSLPLDFVTSTQVILAQKGKGKSYTAAVEAEELLDAKQQIVVVDPTGAHWGLRSSPDGKSSGYSIAVLGGEHADVPLEATAGEVIADAIAAEHFSAILDMSLFRKGEALRFMAAFLETLYRKNRSPLHLFIDEADSYCPQKMFGPEQARCLGAAEDIVRRGRIRGIGCTLITQRPQVLNKDVLTQADMLTTLGMNHPKDLDAISAWVAVHGDPAKAKTMIGSLPSLPKGDAWVWNPSIDLFKRVTIRARHTFDSGRTPAPGERKVEAKVLASVDIKRLGADIAATVERQKANDPAALKRRVAELEKQVAAKVVDRDIKPAKMIEKAVIKDAQLARIGVLLGAGDALVDRIAKAGIRAEELMDSATDKADQVAVKIAAELDKLRATIASTKAPTHSPRTGRSETAGRARSVARPTAAITSQVPNVGRRDVTAGETALPIGEAATLRALISYPDGLDRRQLTVLTGYKKSTRDAYVARLREKGLVDTAGVRVIATTAGIAAMPDAEPLPSGRALQDHWLRNLPSGEGAILAKLLEVNGDVIGRDALTEATGLKKSTRDAYLSRLAAKELVIDAGRGFVKASPTLFEVG